MFFWSWFWESLFPHLFNFGDSLGVPRELIFRWFCLRKFRFSWKGGTLVFAHLYNVLAWFCKVWDLLRVPENRKKRFPNYHFLCGNKGTQTVFLSFWTRFWGHFGVPFGRLLELFNWLLEVFCCFSWEVSRGPPRDRSWLHFGLILHRFYEHDWCNTDRRHRP